MKLLLLLLPMLGRSRIFRIDKLDFFLCWFRLGFDIEQTKTKTSRKKTPNTGDIISRCRRTRENANNFHFLAGRGQVRGELQRRRRIRRWQPNGIVARIRRFDAINNEITESSHIKFVYSVNKTILMWCSFTFCAQRRTIDAIGKTSESEGSVEEEWRLQSGMGNADDTNGIDGDLGL